MIDSRQIFTFLTIMCLVLIIGCTQIAPSHDPIIGAWNYHANVDHRGMNAYIQFDSDGTYSQNIEYCQVMTITNQSVISCRGLAPIQGNWKKEWNGTYQLTRDNIIQLWDYSSSQNGIYNNDDNTQVYFR